MRPRMLSVVIGCLLVFVIACEKKPQVHPTPRRILTKRQKSPPKAVKRMVVRKTPKRRTKPKPPPVRWYQPKYRERRFRAPKVKLKQIPDAKKRAIPATIINEGSKESGMVSLTFDACSWNSRPRYDRKVIDILIRTKTPATLFMGGMWVLKRQRDARRLASIPYFEIANHSYLHGHLTKVSTKRLHHEIKWTQEVIYTILGRIPTLFRPPFLEYNKRVARVAGKLGLKTINGLASGDPDPTFTKSVLIRYMRKAIKPGAIVVMHMNKGGKHTAAALPTIIADIKRKGYKLVTTTQLLQYKK